VKRYTKTLYENLCCLLPIRSCNLATQAATLRLAHRALAALRARSLAITVPHIEYLERTRWWGRFAWQVLAYGLAYDWQPDPTEDSIQTDHRWDMSSVLPCKMLY